MTLALKTPDHYMTFAPDWYDGVIYNKKFKTNILLSKTGVEQRNTIFQVPRRTISFSVSTTSQAETAYLKRYVRLYKASVWGVPLWFHRMVLSSPAEAGGSTINVEDTTNRDMSLAAYILIRLAYNNWEARPIDSYDANSITLSSVLVNSWNANTKVFPVMICELQNHQEFKMITPQNFIASFQFAELFRMVHV